MRKLKPRAERRTIGDAVAIALGELAHLRVHAEHLADQVNRIVGGVDHVYDLLAHRTAAARSTTEISN